MNELLRGIDGLTSQLKEFDSERQCVVHVIQICL
jgi:hypothetical protein